MSKIVIGFAGVARAGKNTAAEALSYPVVAFADPLKADLKPIFDNLGLDLSNPDHKAIARPMLVAYGHVARHVKPNYWIERMEDRLLNYSQPVVVVADVRYVNEARWIQGNGGLVLMINRPEFVPANDEELTSFTDIKRCLVMGSLHAMPAIENDGTVESLQNRVRYLVGKFLHEKAVAYS